MNSEEEYNSPPPSGKDSFDMIQDHTERTVNMTIDKCIDIVNDAYLGFDGDVMTKGKYTNEVFMGIIQRLKNMKSK